jgi:hypothetical protein
MIVSLAEITSPSSRRTNFTTVLRFNQTRRTYSFRLDAIALAGSIVFRIGLKLGRFQR